MAILSVAELAGIKEDIAEIIGDDVLATNIIYKQTGTTISDFNPVDGLVPSSFYTNSGVSAFKGSYSLDEMDVSKGTIEEGDVKFIFMANATGGVSGVSGILSVDDMIVESSSTWQSQTTYQVKAISTDPLNIAYFAQVRSC